MVYSIPILANENNIIFNLNLYILDGYLRRSQAILKLSLSQFLLTQLRLIKSIRKMSTTYLSPCGWFIKPVSIIDLCERNWIKWDIHPWTFHQLFRKFYSLTCIEWSKFYTHILAPQWTLNRCNDIATLIEGLHYSIKKRKKLVTVATCQSVSR